MLYTQRCAEGAARLRKESSLARRILVPLANTPPLCCFLTCCVKLITADCKVFDGNNTHIGTIREVTGTRYILTRKHYSETNRSGWIILYPSGQAVCEMLWSHHSTECINMRGIPFIQLNQAVPITSPGSQVPFGQFVFSFQGNVTLLQINPQFLNYSCSGKLNASDQRMDRDSIVCTIDFPPDLGKIKNSLRRKL